MIQILRFTVPRFCNTLTKATVFSDARLKIDHFKKEQKFYEKKYANNTEPIKKKIQTSVKENNANFSLSELVAAIHLSNSPSDVNTAINATKLLLAKNMVPVEQIRGLGISLMRLVYVLDQTKTGLNMLQDKDLKKLFGVGFTHLILMNKLMLGKDYENVVNLFDKQLPYFTVESSSSKTIKTAVPFDQLSIVFHALLCMNTKESFAKMKSIVQHLEVKKSKLNNICLARCFLLSIQQKEYEYGLRLLQKFDQIDHSLNLNLAIIALCELDLVNDALKLAKDLSSIGIEVDGGKFNGRFFKQTLKSLKEGVERSNSDELANRFRDLESSINQKRNFLSFDLFNYCNDSSY